MTSADGTDRGVAPGRPQHDDVPAHGLGDGLEDGLGDSAGDDPVRAEVAAALAGVEDLSGVPLGEHHGRLERVHEVLHGVLGRARQQG